MRLRNLYTSWFLQGLRSLNLRRELVQSTLKRAQQNEIRRGFGLTCLVVGDEHLGPRQVHPMIHILPRRGPGTEVEHGEVVRVLGPSFIGPD